MVIEETVNENKLILSKESKIKILHASAGFLVGAGGFGPPKSLTTDLQSAPFGHSGTLPIIKPRT